MSKYSLYIDMVKQEIIIEKSPDTIKHRIPFYIDQLAGITVTETIHSLKAEYVKNLDRGVKAKILNTIYSDIDYLYLLLLIHLKKHPIEIEATKANLESKLRKQIRESIINLMKSNKYIDRSKKQEILDKLFEAIKFTVKQKGDKCDRGSKGFGWDGQDLFISEED